MPQVRSCMIGRKVKKTAIHSKNTKEIDYFTTNFIIKKKQKFYIFLIVTSLSKLRKQNVDGYLKPAKKVYV